MHREKTSLMESSKSPRAETHTCGCKSFYVPCQRNGGASSRCRGGVRLFFAGMSLVGRKKLLDGQRGDIFPGRSNKGSTVGPTARKTRHVSPRAVANPGSANTCHSVSRQPQLNGQERLFLVRRRLCDE